MSWSHPWVLALLPLVGLLWWLGRRSGTDDLARHFAPELYARMLAKGSGWSRRVRRNLLLLATALVVVALAGPYLDRGTVRLKARSYDLAVAFDISRSMFADDIFPNRLALAKRKFYDLLGSLKEARVAVLGFSSRAFLVAPPTRDYASLKYLVEHMGFDYVTLKGTDMLTPLEVTAQLYPGREPKALLLFTDGGDTRDFSKEIAYAKAHGIRVFVYAVATRKGGVMRLKEGVVRDSDGNVVVTRLNPAVAQLAKETGGLYMPYSLHKGDMAKMARAIRRSLAPKEGEESVIRDIRPLFHYPLALALLLFTMYAFSLPRIGSGGGPARRRG
ncbi:vWA domain-containing protein [Hydrogenimonas sp.]